MKDRSEELSTADLAGQTGGPGGATVADERGQTGERSAAGGVADTDGTPGDRPVDRPGPDGLTDDGRGGGAEATGFADADREPPGDRAQFAGTDREAGRGSYTGPGDTMTDGHAGDGGAMAGGGYAGPGDATADRGGYAGGGAPGSMPAPSGAGTGAAGTSGGGHEAGPLLPAAESEGFRARWTDVQTGFVDAPRRAVEQADGLVAELMQHLAKTFADERGQLESQWDRGDDVPTDDLRTAFQRYRSFFERLLST